MATENNGTRRAFTLVELMLVVALVGVLAALAIYGVRKYLAQSRTAEAKTNVGAIMKGAYAAFERENATAEGLAEGTGSKTASHFPCLDAIPVPAAVTKGRKYQPITTDGNDFQSGDATTGWKCLKFFLEQPIYYQYHYYKDKTVAAPNNPAKCTASCVEAGAVGDTDGNGAVARFAMTGFLTLGGALKTATQIYAESEHE